VRRLESQLFLIFYSSDQETPSLSMRAGNHVGLLSLGGPTDKGYGSQSEIEPSFEWDISLFLAKGHVRTVQPVTSTTPDNQSPSLLNFWVANQPNKPDHDICSRSLRGVRAKSEKE